ncbi:hypothetical protein TIFTF001_014229 [Ficus carica]|uniref:Uncharacterized protein n=1 Tax=Ficus carica TaxID=3494 RepID=A0AA88DIE8_FICCA|nr:hypothetical protein TIFTF001_014229 [Ficus carica]
MKDYVVTVTKSIATSSTVATPVATLGTIATPHATSATTVAEFDDSKSDCSNDYDDLSFEDIQRAYKEMCDKLIQVCKINKSLEIHIDELRKENDVLKRAVINYEFLATEKERKLQETRLELENTQKSLKMLNFGTTKLDHILYVRKSSGDHHGLRYMSESSSSKTVFVKGTSIPEPSLQPAMNSEHKPPRCKTKRFVPACHFGTY